MGRVSCTCSLNQRNLSTSIIIHDFHPNMAPMLYGKRGRNEEEDSDLEESEVEDGISSVSEVRHALYTG
jgi:hypothetical protein